MGGFIRRLLYTNIVIFFRSKDGQYELVWLEDGSVAFKANNGKFVGTKKSGHLYANCDTLDEPNAKYYFYLINRYFMICNIECNDDFVFHNSKVIKSSDSHEKISPKVLKIWQKLECDHFITYLHHFIFQSFEFLNFLQKNLPKIGKRNK